MFDFIPVLGILNNTFTSFFSYIITCKGLMYGEKERQLNMKKILIYIIAFCLVVSIFSGVAYVGGLVVGVSFLQSLKMGIVWTVLMTVSSLSLKGLQAQIES